MDSSRPFRVDRLAIARKIAQQKKRPGKGRPKGGEPEPVPVEPEKPKPLSGGAAAALEFDD